MSMTLQNSKYHMTLRTSAVVMALMLLFESGIVHKSTIDLSMQTHQYLASAIGMSAYIEPTELNSLTAELTAQRLALETREAALREREIAVDLANGGGTNQRAIYLLSGILFILLVLIVLNYALDFLRARELRSSNIEQPV